MESRNRKYWFALFFFVILTWGNTQGKLEASLEQYGKELEKLLKNPIALIGPFIVIFVIVYICFKLLKFIFRSCFEKKTFIKAKWEVPEILAFSFLYLIFPVLVSLVMPSFENKILAKFGLYWFVNIISCIFLIWGLKKYFRATNASLGFRKISPKQFWGTFFGYICFWPNYIISIILTTIIFILFKQSPQTQQVAKDIIEAKGIQLWSGIATAVIGAPILEEILFRMFLYSGLRKPIGVYPALIVSSLVFALVHQNIFAFFPIFLLGFYLAFLYERTQTLWIPILTHALHNGLTLLYMLLVVR